MASASGKKLMIYGIIVLVALVLFLVLINRTAPSSNNDALAKYLTANGVVMYGTEWCTHCQNQKKMFGKSFQYINFVDCDKDPGRCEAANVTGYPTWVINGQNYPGEQSLQRLAQLSGFGSNTSNFTNASNVSNVSNASGV